MKIYNTPEKKENLSLALGFFDGIHKGHKKVIEQSVYYAKENNLKSAVISFIEHPSCILLKRNPEYILSIEDKVKKIEKLGIDYLYLLDFNLKFAQLSKEEYFNYLCNFTKPKAITTGFNHFFAKDKEGDTNFLQKICKKNNIFYQKIEPVKLKNLTVSSSEIRNFLQCANLEMAKKMLGYNFYTKGEIIKGKQIGSNIGFKTINIEYPSKIIQLPYGVYCSKVTIDNKNYTAVTNWGIQPTVSKENKPLIEAHILNFNQNIYGKNVKISFLTRIRNEKKFDTLSELKKQITKDVEFCKNYIEN